MTFQPKPRGIPGKTKTPPPGRPTTIHDKAYAWLKGYLSSGQRSLTDIYMVGTKQERDSKRMLQQCAVELGVVSSRVYTTYWRLPGQVPMPPRVPATIPTPPMPSAMDPTPGPWSAFDAWSDEDYETASVDEINARLRELADTYDWCEKEQDVRKMETTSAEIRRARQWMARGH